MAAASQRHPKTECTVCGTNYQDGHSPGYCSSECYFTKRGESILRHIRQDHTHCASCFAKLKSVESPDEEWEEQRGDPYYRSLDLGGEVTSNTFGELVLDYTDVSDTRPVATDSVIGFEYYTQHATRVDAGPRRPPGMPQPGKHAIGCECGNIDLRSEFQPCRNGDLKQTLVNLVALLRRYYQEGQLDKKPDVDALFTALKQSGGDFPYAIGVSLE